jgi:serine phosphatase RsbU (regulator of sigma subunit)/anti-sigma regulatory factor (Ser/Thr protein kinase)
MNRISKFFRRKERRAEPEPTRSPSVTLPTVEIAANDPLLAYLQSTAGALDIENLALDSQALKDLREAGIRLVVPLVNQGELIGLFNLGPRLSEQEYSADDRHLLENLAARVAPAVMVAQLVRQQEQEARTRERFEQELRVAQLIQQNFLPREAPDIEGWKLVAYYQPAREVGGDFYDFIPLPDGRLGLVIGDVTDKGVPAALVMASTRSIIRGAAQRFDTPGQVLENVNDLLCPDIPPNMFATCLYGILDPKTGQLVFANAGHNLPYLYTTEGPQELRATGMPLGLLPGMTYEESAVCLQPGQCILLHSDGLVEAHNNDREMFGFPRLLDLVGVHGSEDDLIETLCRELSTFTGRPKEQEDDVTLVTLTRTNTAGTTDEGRPRILGEFMVESQPGNERQTIELVTQAMVSLELRSDQLEQLLTAVGEATMNAMEHGNHYRDDLPVTIRVVSTPTQVLVSITDHGGDSAIPEAQTPDLEAKLAGLQTPRGWGLFLIQNMVDEVRTFSEGHHHTVELILNLGDDQDA